MRPWVLLERGKSLRPPPPSPISSSIPPLPSPQTPALDGPGACGYGPLPPSFGPVAALSPVSPLLSSLGGNGCGACVEVTCADETGATCASGAAVVARLADACAGCAPDQVNLHASLYASLGANPAAHPTLPAVAVRAVPCPGSGSGVTVRVRGGGPPVPAAPLLIPLGLASPPGSSGRASILEGVAVRPAGGTRGDWTPLAPSYGGVWALVGPQAAAPPPPVAPFGFLFAPPQPLPPAPLNLGPGPFDVRLVGEGGNVLVLPALVPSLADDGEWVSGSNFGPPPAPRPQATPVPPPPATTAPPPATTTPPATTIPAPTTPTATAVTASPPPTATPPTPTPGETVAPLPPPKIVDGGKLNLRALNGDNKGDVGAVTGDVGVMSVSG